MSDVLFGEIGAIRAISSDIPVAGPKPLQCVSWSWIVGLFGMDELTIHCNGNARHVKCFLVLATTESIFKEVIAWTIKWLASQMGENKIEHIFSMTNKFDTLLLWKLLK